MQGCTRYRYTKFCIGNRFVEPYFLWKAGASRISIMILWGGVTVLHENAVGCRGHWNVWGALPLTLCLLLYSSNLSFFIRSFFSGSHSEIWRPSNGWKNWWKKSVKWLVGQWIVGVISFQKIFCFCGLMGHLVEKRYYVTFVDNGRAECENMAGNYFKYQQLHKLICSLRLGDAVKMIESVYEKHLDSHMTKMTYCLLLAP